MTDDRRTTDAVDRLRAADPARPADPDWPARLQHLVEAAMSTTDQDVPVTPRPTARRRWAVPAAAAAVAVAAVAVAGAALVGGLPGGDAEPSRRPGLELALPGEDGAMASCVPFSAEFLADMPVAFAGTVTSVTDEEVVLEVDRWYRGGSADSVVLTRPPPAAAALLGSVEFSQGKRYLVTATDGVVNSCGFTMPWTADNAAVFDQAFSG